MQLDVLKMVEYEKNRRSVGEEDRKGMREIFRHVATSRNIGKPDGKLVARWWKRREKIAEALDCKPAELRLHTEKAITQLRYIARGADEFLKGRRSELNRSHPFE